MRTITIGRSSEAQIRLDDPSVSRMHAELTISDEGAYFLIDRNSTHGTQCQRDGDWTDIRQDFVGDDLPLRFGGYETTVQDLMRNLSGEENKSNKSGKQDAPPPAPEPSASSRPVKRNPLTGEVITR